VHVDLSLHRRDLEKAVRQGILIEGKTYELRQQVPVGTTRRVVLTPDGCGAATSWLELLVVDPERPGRPETFTTTETPEEGEGTFPLGRGRF
jgi:hypothetical protein